MKTHIERAYAKLNLTLEVCGKREDGYHDIRSIMQTISLRDEVELSVGTRAPWRIECSDASLPTCEANLAWKAAEAFFGAARQSPDGLLVRIVKRIPQQAGLGGGSADAGAVLRALNRIFGSPFSAAELAALGASVGSDVPFCTLGGAAMAEGRGERLRRLACMPKCALVIVKPPFAASTPALYRLLDARAEAVRANHGALEQALAAGDLRGVAQNLRNAFDPLVSSLHPSIGAIKAALFACGALGCQLTGSGSAVYAVMPDEASAAAARARLAGSGNEVFLAEPTAFG